MKSELKIILVLLFLVVFGFFGFAEYYRSLNSGSVTEESKISETAKLPVSEKLVRPDSPSQGPENARVTVVEFLDPECESCRAFYPEVKRILKEYEGRLRFVVRYMPFHSNSVVAASATEAAGKQGKYWEMQELLFARQPEWSHKEEPQRELMMNYAKDMSLEIDKFAADFSNILVFQKIEQDRLDGVSLGVKGTPTFFINGKILEQLSYEALKKEIDMALKTTDL
jgi:protein-disulfide isomerase